MTLNHDACYRALTTRDARFDDGRLFVGVKTTGVYCRPTCSARTPRQRNVEFFTSAAAAQAAGYRPCLRCRPELSPALAAWHGTSRTVTRALALIADGALNDGNVDRLAERLGIGERHLRRLFRHHLGASPLVVAQTQRVLFAKQLLAETTMSMADVALAAGFRSVRRFNATFRALYHRPPRALRPPRRPQSSNAPRAANVATVELLLPYAPPYDWESMVGFLAERAIPGVEHVDDQGRYWRTVALEETAGWVRVSPDAHHRGLRATLCFPRVTALSTLIGRLRRLFDLTAHPQAIAAHLSTDPTLRPLLQARPGLRVPGAWDPFELAVRAVLGQRITVAGATRLAGQIVRRYGTPFPHQNDPPDGLTHLFLRPAQWANVDVATLGVPAARAKTLSSLAMAAHSNHLFVTDDASPDVIARLREIPGIGDWTAQYIALRALRDPDAFPASDLGLRRVLAAREGRSLGVAELTARAEAWRPWRAYAALHLWVSERSLLASSSSTTLRSKGGLRGVAA